LRLGINPVQVLEDQQDRLDLALPKDEAFDAFQDSLPPLGGVKGLPLQAIQRCVQNGEERRQEGFQRPVQCKDLLGEMLGGVRFRRSEARLSRRRTGKRVGALGTELGGSGNLGAAVRAGSRQRRCALFAELRLWSILVLAVATPHAVASLDVVPIRLRQP
jgi:hypothetical protein